MDIWNYYTAIPDDNTSLAVFVKNGTFSWENNGDSKRQENEENSVIEEPARFYLSNVSFTISQVTEILLLRCSHLLNYRL